MTNRIIKRIAVYAQELGNSRRSGQPFSAERFKSKSHKNSSQESRRPIYNYIKQYEEEIKTLEEQLKVDPNNQELIEQLKDKKKRKQQFEDELTINTDYAKMWQEEEQQKAIEREKRKQLREQEQQQYRQGVEQRRQDQNKINTQALKELPDYIQKLVDNASNYEVSLYNRLISSDINIFRKNLYNHFCKYLKDAAKKFLSNKKYVGSGEFKIKSQEVIDNTIKKVPLNIVDKFIGQFTIIASGKELLQYLHDTNLINEVIPAVLTNIKYFWKKSQDTVSHEEYLSKSNIAKLITKKIIAIWKANKFKMMDYNQRHNTKYVAFSMSSEQLDVIVRYLINNTDIINQAKKIITGR